MRFTITVFTVLLTLYCTSAFAQVRKWVDEKGTVHYEATGPEQPPKAAPGESNPNARRPIERNHGGLTLGDDESAFTAGSKGRHLAKHGADGNYYQYSGPLPEGALSTGALFVGGRLALILVEYNLAPGGWEQLLNQTSATYGPPTGDTRTAVWNDSTTSLTLTHEANGNITVVLQDQSMLSKYSEQLRAALPKF